MEPAAEMEPAAWMPTEPMEPRLSLVTLGVADHVGLPGPPEDATAA